MGFKVGDIVKDSAGNLYRVIECQSGGRIKVFREDLSRWVQTKWVPRRKYLRATDLEAIEAKLSGRL